MPETQFHGKLSSDETAILKMIEADANVNIPDLASKIAKSPETIKRLLKKLQESNVIERIGSKKTGTWHLKANN